jgi:hypothetical protein
MINHSSSIILEHRVHEVIEAMKGVNNGLFVFWIRISEIGQSEEDERSCPNHSLAACKRFRSNPSVWLDTVQNGIDDGGNLIF